MAGNPRILLTFFLLSIFIFFSGCNESLPDRYISGSDSQYYQYTSVLLSPFIQQTDEGCYITHGSYIYYFDITTGNFMPLCSKPDCLHDRETEETKKDTCNAYLPNIYTGSTATIQLYGDELFACYTSIGDLSKGIGSVDYIYKFGIDGSYREKVWETKETINEFCIHRGHIYMTTGMYAAENNTVKAKFKLIDADMGKIPAFKYDEIFTYETTALASLYRIRAYGNYIYFRFSMSDNEEASGEYVYSTKSRQLYQLIISDENGSAKNVNNIAFFKDKLLMIGYVDNGNLLEDLYIPTEIYEAELDGSNQKIVLTDIPQGYYIDSDGKYFYVNNAFNVKNGDADTDKDQKLWVYNMNYELVDVIGVPTMPGYLETPMGTADVQYIYYMEDDANWGLKIWDKSDIGLYNGRSYEQEKVAYN